MKTVTVDQYLQMIKCPHCKIELELPSEILNGKVTCPSCKQDFMLKVLAKNDFRVPLRLFWRCLSESPWSMKVFIWITLITAGIILWPTVFGEQDLNYIIFVHLWLAHQILTRGSKCWRIVTCALNVFGSIAGMIFDSAFVVEWAISLLISISTTILLFLPVTSCYMDKRRNIMSHLV